MECFMYNLTSKFLLGSLLCLLVSFPATPARAQSFGSSMARKKLILQRKLPPTGHVDGTTIKVIATAKGFQADIAPDLASTLEALLIRNDSRLRSEDTHPDTLINCQVTTYAQPPAQTTMQPGMQIGKTPAKATPLTRVTGILTVSFTAKDTKNSRSIAADTVTAKFDQEYTASGAQQPGFAASFKHLGDQITKGKQEDDKPPTAAELHNRLIQDAAEQIASHLVVTTEHIDVLLAKGGALDEANKLAEEKLWTRALEQLETMTPFPQKEEDAYRLYNIGVMNEALAYDAEDVKKARTYLLCVDRLRKSDRRKAHRKILPAAANAHRYGSGALQNHRRAGLSESRSRRQSGSKCACARIHGNEAGCSNFLIYRIRTSSRFPDQRPDNRHGAGKAR
jgi:hypothetical protein